MSFCDYCGDELALPDTCLVNQKPVHTECRDIHIRKRDEALNKIKDFIPIRNHVLSMGIHVSYLYGPGKDNKKEKKSKKKQRNNKLHELLRMVCALRNSGSGAVLIHLVGLESDDSFTGAFDEFADEKLNAIIHDGKLFFDVYKKQVLSACEHLSDYNDFLLLFVEGASYVTTYDFNTKVGLDDRIIDASEINVRSILKERKQFSEEHHRLEDVVFSKDLLKKQESRHLQMKSNFQPTGNDDDIVTSMFEDLKLPQYISAFAKNENGGSFVFGITETYVRRRYYQTRENIEQPVVVNDLDRIRATIKRTATESVLVCDYNGKAVKTPVPDIVDVHFIPSANSNLNEGVLQVAVRPVRGIVFHDKVGPLAFTYNEYDQSVTKLDLDMWFGWFSKRNADADE